MTEPAPELTVLDGRDARGGGWWVTSQHLTERNVMTTVHYLDGCLAFSAAIHGPMLLPPDRPRIWQGRLEISPEMTLTRFPDRFTSAAALLDDRTEVPLTVSEAFPQWGVRFGVAVTDQAPTAVRFDGDGDTITVTLVDPHGDQPGGWVPTADLPR